MSKIKIAIADDNRDLVKMMEAYFENHESIEVMFSASNGKVCIKCWSNIDRMFCCLILLCHI